MMKAYTYIAATIAASALALVGCAENQTQSSMKKTAANQNPGQESYDQHQLERTGGATPGEGLRKADPSIGR
jgi:PBP1b-binding outer membrane lipoprotein LpoB